MAIPKGFFPQQDTGFIFGLAEGAQDVSIQGMVERELALADIIAKDPDIATFAFAVGPTGGGAQTPNNGRFWINLKPIGQRKASADQIINRLRPQLARVNGVTLFLQVAQDISVGGRVARTQYQYTLQGSDLNELLEWGPRVLDGLRKLSELQIAIERGMLQIEEALMPEMPDIASRVQTLVADVMSQYNAVVTGVQRQARTAH